MHPDLPSVFLLPVPLLPPLRLCVFAACTQMDVHCRGLRWGLTSRPGPPTRRRQVPAGRS